MQFCQSEYTGDCQMNTTEECRRERKDVVIIGNGPSAISLSYILSGNIPRWNGCPVSNDYLNVKLEQVAGNGQSLLEQDLEYLSDGLEGRSRNPVALLIDALLHPDADLGSRAQSKLTWRHDPTAALDHICLGRGQVGGAWSQLTSKQLQTISLASWLELPNYSMAAFRLHRRLLKRRHSHSNHPVEPIEQENGKRATYDEVRAYYLYYVKRQHLTHNFRPHSEVTLVQRVCIDPPFYDDATQEIRTPDPIWEIRGYNENDRTPFVYYAKNVVFATGTNQKLTRPLGVPGEEKNAVSTVLEIEQLICQKWLSSFSKPLLVVGCGLSAIDALLLCQFHNIPVLHVFRRSITDYELVINKPLPSDVYPDYDQISRLIKRTAMLHCPDPEKVIPTRRFSECNQPVNSSTISRWSYRCMDQSDIVFINSDLGIVGVRDLRTMSMSEHEISFIAKLTGAQPATSLLQQLLPTTVTSSKFSYVNVNPYTYECTNAEGAYALGPLVGDNLVRFLQGGTFACAASLLKERRQAQKRRRASSLRSL